MTSVNEINAVMQERRRANEEIEKRKPDLSDSKYDKYTDRELRFAQGFRKGMEYAQEIINNNHE